MRLLQVIPYLHPRAGGPPVVVNRHSELLVRRGWEVSIVTTDLHSGGNVREVEDEVPDGVELRLLRVDRPALLGLSSSAAPVLASEVGNADLVHVHTLWHPLLTRTRRLCRSLDKPLLVMPHGMLDPWSLGVRRIRKALYLASVEKRNLRAAVGLVYTTEEERRLAEASITGLPPGSVVPLGADAPWDRDAGHLVELFLERFPVARGRRILLFLSRVHPKKGLDRLLAVLPSLIEHEPKLLLAIVGSGERAHVSAVRNQVEALGLDESVLFCGRLAGDVKWGAYAASEVFVLPSRQENFGIVVAEAMQMGLPVVVSDRVNSCSYVEEARAGVVCDASDPEALLTSVGRLLRDRAEAEAMGSRGREAGRSRLAWSASVDALESCYQAVLESRPEPAI